MGTFPFVLGALEWECDINRWLSNKGNRWGLPRSSSCRIRTWVYKQSPMGYRFLILPEFRTKVVDSSNKRGHKASAPEPKIEISLFSFEFFLGRRRWSVLQGERERGRLNGRRCHKILDPLLKRRGRRRGRLLLKGGDIDFHRRRHDGQFQSRGASSHRLSRNGRWKGCRRHQ